MRNDLNEKCIKIFIHMDNNSQKQHYPYEQKYYIIWILVYYYIYYIFSYCTWATMLSTSYYVYL
jgi:hypothetical protein